MNTCCELKYLAYLQFLQFDTKQWNHVILKYAHKKMNLHINR